VSNVAIYAIGDLHLSFSNDKPMSIFGSNWDNHYEKIKDNWLKKVNEEDVVLILGDTSWGMKPQEARKDLEFVDALPGHKVLIKGNHDYWWETISKNKRIFNNLSIDYIQNNSIQYKDIAICGTRGWICPNEMNFTDKDKKIYMREVNRLKISLESANKDVKEIIVIMHYPPMNSLKQESEFTSLLKEYNVKKVLYGHLHGEASFSQGPMGYFDGIFYKLVSCDYLNFDLARID
jgi:predicted phosphohydrolase